MSMNTLSRTLSSASALCMVAAIYAPTAAFAQENDGQQASEGGLTEIVVTAQKRKQGANDVGITLNAFSGDELANRGVSSAEDVALLTPGLTVNETSATGVPLYTIRGVGFQDYSTAASSTVGLYFDEVAIPYSVMSRGAVFDVERVEVLKGPQGDLYGRNTTAGQINYVSSRPTDETKGKLKLGYSSFQTVDIEGFMSGPVADNANGRIAFVTSQSNRGWQQSLTRPNDRLGEVHEFAVRGLLDVDMGAAKLALKAQFIRDKSDNKANTAYDGRLVGFDQYEAPYVQLAPYAETGKAPWYSTGNAKAADWTNSYTDPSGKVFDIRPRRNSKMTSLAANFSYELSDAISLTSVTGYDRFNRAESNDWDGSHANDSSNINTSLINVFSEEMRLSGSGDKLDWVGGLYYSDDYVEELYNYIMPDSTYGNGAIPFAVEPFLNAPILQLHTKYRQDTTSKAVFGHAEYKVTDTTRITGGLRYTDEKRSWTGCTYDAGDGSLSGFMNYNFGSTLGPRSCGTIDDDPNSANYIFNFLGGPDVDTAFHPYSETIRAKKWMYKLGADTKISDDILLYGTFSHGFKSGGFNGANSNTTKQLKAYKPEEINSYEVGLKSTLLDRTMQLNLSGFYYDYKNKQEQDLAVTFVGNISGLTNVPKSRIYGAELDLQWAPIAGLNAYFGAAYLNTKVKEWSAVSMDSAWPDVTTFNASGTKLASSPTWQLNGGVEYETPVSDDMKIGFGFDGNYKGKAEGGARGNAYATDAYTVFNARLKLAESDDKWALTLWSRNLFDTYYYPAAYLGGNGPYVRSNGMPRTIGVTGDFRF